MDRQSVSQSNRRTDSQSVIQTNRQSDSQLVFLCRKRHGPIRTAFTQITLKESWWSYEDMLSDDEIRNKSRECLLLVGSSLVVLLRLLLTRRVFVSDGPESLLPKPKKSKIIFCKFIATVYSFYKRWQTFWELSWQLTDVSSTSQSMWILSMDVKPLCRNTSKYSGRQSSSNQSSKPSGFDKAGSLSRGQAGKDFKASIIVLLR